MQHDAMLSPATPPRRMCRAAVLALMLGAFLTGQPALAAPGNGPAAHPSGCAAQDFPIAVDIGHTPQSPGAISAHGIGEYRFNRRLGEIVVAALRQAGFPAEPILIDGDSSNQLAKRVAAAKRLSPRLLVSLHHDSVQQQYLESWEVNGETFQFSDRFSGYSLFVSKANPAYRQSLAFAGLLGDRLMAAGLAFSPHHAEPIRGEGRTLLDDRRGIYEFRGLRVLKDSAAPAVLVEAGVIVNRQDEMQLATPQRMALVADAITAAAQAFCAGQGLAKRK